MAKKDLNQLAKFITCVATGEKEYINKPEKNPAAVALGRLGGLKGGKARSEKLSAERKSEIAKNAVNQRWANNNSQSSGSV